MSNDPIVSYEVTVELLGQRYQEINHLRELESKKAQPSAAALDFLQALADALHYLQMDLSPSDTELIAKINTPNPGNFLWKP